MTTNTFKTQIHVSEIFAGMTLLVNGELLTVSNKDIKNSGFMGLSFRGDSSKKYYDRIQFVVETLIGTRLE